MHSSTLLATLGASVDANLPAITPAVLLLAKITLLLIAALGLSFALQRASAGTRHLVWLATLGALLVLPAIAAWAPLRIAILPAERAPVERVAQLPVSPSAERALATTNGATASATVTAPDAPEPWIARQAEFTPPTSTPNAPSAVERAAMSPRAILLTVWAAVALLILGWLAHGALSVRRIVRNARPLDGKGWRGPLLEVADRMGLEDAPRLLVSDEAKMPFACGLRTPTIVFPSECEAWSLDRRHAVLLHELAHVKRRDLVSHTLGRLACALYWFHPLAWAAAKRLRAESERACDDLALSCGARASDYAEHLLEIVASVRGDRTPAVAMAMARRREFEGRMLAILDPGLRRTSPGRRQSLIVAGAVGAIALLVGAAAPVARLDAAPEAPTVADARVSSDTNVSSSTPGTASPLRQDGGAAASPIVSARDSARGVNPIALSNATASATPSAPSARQDAPSVENDRAPVTRVGSTSAPTTDVKVQLGQQNSQESQQYNLQRSIQSAVGAGGAPLVAQLKQAREDERPKLLAGVLAKDTSASLRRIAAWGLAEYGDDPVAVAALATALRKDTNVDVREMAAWALAESEHNRDAMTALAAALKGDASSRVRATAAWALGDAGDEEAVPALSAALSDTSEGVRARAVWAIGSIEPRSAPKELLAMLKDADPKVRRMTAWALYNIEDPSAADELEAALRTEKDRDLQIAYVRAIAATGDGAVGPLSRLIESSDPEVRSTAVRALAGARAGGPWPMPWPQPRPYP